MKPKRPGYRLCHLELSIQIHWLPFGELSHHLYLYLDLISTLTENMDFYNRNLERGQTNHAKLNETIQTEKVIHIV